MMDKGVHHAEIAESPDELVLVSDDSDSVVHFDNEVTHCVVPDASGENNAVFVGQTQQDVSLEQSLLDNRIIEIVYCGTTYLCLVDSISPPEYGRFETTGVRFHILDSR